MLFNNVRVNPTFANNQVGLIEVDAKNYELMVRELYEYL